jgi:NADH-quinone oxidoreductase subunit J
MGDYLFYGLATAVVAFSLMTVSLPNLLHGAISLIAAFFVTAALYIMLQLEFLALAQIMLYIGGIIIFMLIIILLTTYIGGIIIFMLIIILLTTGLGVENRHQVPNSRRLAGAGVCVVLLIGLQYVIGAKPSAVLVKNVQRALPVTMDDIGLRLLDSGNEGFIVPFEIISILLLVALVGSVVIARRDNSEPYSQGDGQKESI